MVIELQYSTNNGLISKDIIEDPTPKMNSQSRPHAKTLAKPSNIMPQ